MVRIKQGIQEQVFGWLIRKSFSQFLLTQVASGMLQDSPESQSSSGRARATIARMVLEGGSVTGEAKRKGRWICR